MVIEFLLARIAEDEKAAKAAHSGAWTIAAPWGPHDLLTGLVDKSGARVVDGAQEMLEHIARHDPARVLADCDGQRRTVELHQLREKGRGAVSACRTCGRRHGWPCSTLRFLALPYVNHPSYRPEWAAP
jgi:hypothetical protein